MKTSPLDWNATECSFSRTHCPRDYENRVLLYGIIANNHATMTTASKYAGTEGNIDRPFVNEECRIFEGHLE